MHLSIYSGCSILRSGLSSTANTRRLIVPALVAAVGSRKALVCCSPLGSAIRHVYGRSPGGLLVRPRRLLEAGF